MTHPPASKCKVCWAGQTTGTFLPGLEQEVALDKRPVSSWWEVDVIRKNTR